MQRGRSRKHVARPAGQGMPMPARPRSAAPSQNLEVTLSAALRQELLLEVSKITDADEAANWAGERMGAKNTLMAADAQLVESGFEQKMLEFAAAEKAASASSLVEIGAEQAEVASTATVEQVKAVRAETVRAERIDKSTLTIATPRRLRSKDHLRLVAQQPCLVCGRKPSDPH